MDGLQVVRESVRHFARISGPICGVGPQALFGEIDEFRICLTIVKSHVRFAAGPPVPTCRRLWRDSPQRRVVRP